MTKSCAFFSCAEVEECAMVGGCVQKRFPAPGQNAVTDESVKDGARKLAGTKPARTNRDPRFIKRRRKAL